jgi:hypothetical protein
MNSRYQLVKPILSDKIYEASSVNKGGKKCYKELKSSHIINASTFTIKNIDTSHTFTFKINKPYEPSLNVQGGGDIQVVEPQFDVKEAVLRLEQRMEKLESALNGTNPVSHHTVKHDDNIYETNSRRLQAYTNMSKSIQKDENNDDACIIC